MNKNIVIIILSIFIVVLGGFLYKTMDYMKKNKNNSYDMKEMVLKTLKERRSIRNYKPIQIKEEELNVILEAATYAPSAMNRQPTKLVAVQNPDVIKKLSKINASYLPNFDENNFKDPFYGAPTVVVVFADTTVPTHIYDGSLVMGNLMNAAYAVGLGSCWIHRAREAFSTEEGKALMKLWGIPDNYVGIGNCILGYPLGEHPKAAPRKDDFIYVIK